MAKIQCQNSLIRLFFLWFQLSLSMGMCIPAKIATKCLMGTGRRMKRETRQVILACADRIPVHNVRKLVFSHLLKNPQLHKQCQDTKNKTVFVLPPTVAHLKIKVWRKLAKL